MKYRQKGLPVSEEEGEDEALEKEDYMEQLVGVAEQEIGLKHPLVYDDFNLCDLSDLKPALLKNQ